MCLICILSLCLPIVIFLMCVTKGFSHVVQVDSCNYLKVWVSHVLSENIIINREERDAEGGSIRVVAS